MCGDSACLRRQIGAALLAAANAELHFLYRNAKTRKFQYITGLILDGWPGTNRFDAEPVNFFYPPLGGGGGLNFDDGSF